MADLTPAEELRTSLDITPKTVSLLLKAGYTSHKDLTAVSPNHLLRQIAEGSGKTVREVDGYRRACRWMVWVGTQTDPALKMKTCQRWTQKNLKAMGAWDEGFDDLTGLEIEERFRMGGMGAP